MIIKPNLLKGASGSFHIKNGPNDRWGSRRFVLPKLKDGVKYTASFKARDLNAITNGKVSCIITNIQRNNDIYIFKNIDAADTIFVNFIHVEGRSEMICFYPGEAGNTYNTEGTIYNIKLVEEDKDDSYSPCKDDLEPSKQAVFMAGGIQRNIPSIKSDWGIAYVS